MRKEYYTEIVKQKNGREVPITKMRLVMDCLDCGCEMRCVENRKGGVYKRKVQIFECTNTLCKYREVREGILDTCIKEGMYDEKIGILQPEGELREEEEI